MGNAIVACDLKLAIGANGKLPWEGKLKSEMHHFARMTRNVPGSVATSGGRNAVIMGRKTWQSIPEKFRPLRGRVNVILSKTLQENSSCKDAIIKPGLKDALDFLANRDDIHKIWIIGGSSLYDEAIKQGLCENLYITRVKEQLEETDTFIPDPENFGYERLESCLALDLKEIHLEDGIKYQYEVWRPAEASDSETDS